VGIKTLIVLGILAGVVLLTFWLVARLKGKPDAAGPGYVFKECAACGWKGQASKFHRKCPNCGDTLV
jgi:hypothetical protein